MKNDINAAIQEYIKQDLFNLCTTSDLQGACTARAIQILRKHNKKFDIGNISEINKISDQILNGIYEPF